MELTDLRELAEDNTERIDKLETFANTFRSMLEDFSRFVDPMTREQARDDRRSAAFILANDIRKQMQGQVDELEANLNERFSQLSYTVKEHIVSANENVKKLADSAERSATRETSFTEKIFNIDTYIEKLALSIESLTRETENKATLRELAQQAERFSYYTPLNLLEKLQVETSTKTNRDDFDILADEVKGIKRSLANYIPVTKEAEMMEETTQLVEQKLGLYSTVEDLKSLRSEIYERFSAVKDMTDEGFDYSKERDKMIKSELDVLKDLVQRKPWSADLKPIIKELGKKATNNDLEKLRSDAMPSIADCYRRLNEFRNDLDKFDRALGRFDEIICDKASKGDIMDVKKSIKGFLDESKFYEKVEQIHEMFKKADIKTETLAEELPKVHTRLEHLQLQLNSQKQEARDYKLVYNTLMDLRDKVDSKADMSDLVRVAERSALWSDAQVLKQQAELLRRQVESAAVLSASLSRTLLKDIDTPGVKYRRRAEVYRLLLSLLDWIKTNKTSGVPEDLVEFEGTADQTLKTPRTIKNLSHDIGLEMLKPKSGMGTKRRQSTSSPRDRKDLPPIKIHNAFPCSSLSIARDFTSSSGEGGLACSVSLKNLVPLISLIMASNTLTFPVSRDLIAALKDLSAQPATGLQDRSHSVEAVKKQLAFFSSFISSGTYDLSQSSIAKLILKVHQTVLEVTDHFSTNNNCIEAHGLLSIIGIPPTARGSPSHSDFEVEIAPDIQPDASGQKLRLPLDLIMLSVTARGLFNIYIQGVLGELMNRIGKTAKQLPGFFGSAVTLCRGVKQHKVDQERYNTYLQSFVWGEKDQIENTLDSLSSDLWHCLLADDKESMQKIERLLIGLLGHWDERIRSLATIHLNAFYDDTDWQLLEPFNPKVRTVGHDFKISERIDGSIDEEVILELHALNFAKESGNYIVSFHKPEITRSSRSTTLKVDFGAFPRCGFYDWRFVVVGSGSLQPLMCSNSSDRLYNSVGELRTFPVQGRFIVHPADVRDLQMHELFVDFQDAEFDYNTNQYIRRGTFRDITASLRERFSSGINCLYVMGALERDTGISHDKVDASPLAVVDRRSPCSLVGGESGFAELVREAKNIGIHILVDCLTRISSTNYHRRYKNEQLLHRNEQGHCVILYGSDGKSINYEDTAMLNYRKAEVWELLIDDILSFVKKYKVDGIHIDNAHAWPQVYELDIAEMYRKDADGEPHYNTQEIFDGLVVLRNENFGYWGCEASKRYASPLFLKLCKELWRSYPSFYIVADVWTGDELEGRERVVARSGGIPRMYELPVKLAAICGKKLEKNGTFEACERKDVGILRKWFEDRKKYMPDGAIVVQSSTGHHLPYPALLFGRGAWAAADALLLLPDVPMTFSGEQSGHAFRPHITSIYKQENPSSRILPKPISAVNLMHDGVEELLEKPIVPRVESSTSLSAIMSLKELKNSEQRLIKEVGPEYGFDLTQINLHYKHRRMLRCEKEVIRTGELIPLVVKHAHGWHKQVLAFARFSPDETALVVINFNDHPVKGYLDLQKLESYFNSLESNIFSIGKWSDPDTDDYFLKEELLSESHEVELNPFKSELYGIYPSEVEASQALKRSVDRFMKKLSNNQSTDKSFLSKKLLNLLNKDVVDLLAVGNHLGLVHQYALQPYAVSTHDYIMSMSEINPVLAGRLLAYCQTIKELKGTFNSARIASTQIIETNKLGPIVFTAPELGRWSTAGGLGVMVDELSIGLANLGEEVWMISPYYDINKKGETGYLANDPADIKWVANLNIIIGGINYVIGVHRGWENGVHYLFLHNSELFPTIYADGPAHFVIKQMVGWARGTMELLCYLQVVPAVLLTNDWFTGLVPAYAKNGTFGQTFMGTTFFHIIHNLDPTYEGRQYPTSKDGFFEHLHNLPGYLFVDPYWQRTVVNPSRCALLCSDQWATVSSSYRNDLLTTSPLKELLKQKQRPFAFPNGIPVESRKNRLKRLGTHREAKAEVQRKYFGFGELDDSIPVLSFVGRVTEQKGVHLILDAAEKLIPHYNQKIQFLVGGPANPKEPYSFACATRMRNLRTQYPNSFYANPDEFFMDGPLVNLGSDFGLMPSKFEPGGIVQHEFFVAGTPVIAFETGGLKDTVIEYDPVTGKGGGFTFRGFFVTDMLFAVDRALAIFRNKDQYEQLRKNAEVAVVDVKEVSRAWCQELYRLRNKIFCEPHERDRYLRILSSTSLSAEDFVPVIPSNKQKIRISRTPSGMMLSKLPQENRPAQPSQEQKRRVLIRYQTRGNKVKSVQVTGSFDKWQVRYPMMYDHSNAQWYLTLQLPKGKHFYKFVVEGSAWVCSLDHPQEQDQSGIFNNIIIVE